MRDVLPNWGIYLLRFAGVYNLLAGFSMIVFYHEGYKLMGLQKPALVMPVQLVGILVLLFGVGYLIVSRGPLENRNVLLLGCLSKSLGSLLGLYYLAIGKLPLIFLVVLFFADIIYVPPFCYLLFLLYRAAKTMPAR